MDIFSVSAYWEFYVLSVFRCAYLQIWEIYAITPLNKCEYILYAKVIVLFDSFVNAYNIYILSFDDSHTIPWILNTSNFFLFFFFFGLRYFKSCVFQLTYALFSLITSFINVLHYTFLTYWFPYFNISNLLFPNFSVSRQNSLSYSFIDLLNFYWFLCSFE